MGLPVYNAKTHPLVYLSWNSHIKSTLFTGKLLFLCPQHVLALDGGGEAPSLGSTSAFAQAQVIIASGLLTDG